MANNELDGNLSQLGHTAFFLDLGTSRLQSCARDPLVSESFIQRFVEAQRRGGIAFGLDSGLARLRVWTFSGQSTDAA